MLGKINTEWKFMKNNMGKPYQITYLTRKGIGQRVIYFTIITFVSP